MIGAPSASAENLGRELDIVAAGSRNRASKMPADVASAYRSVFRQRNVDEMAELACAESTSVALKAAWCVTELRCAERPDIRPLAWFSGIIEGRLKAKPPAWWEACLLASKFDDGDRRLLKPGSCADIDEDLLERHTIELGDDLLTVPSDAELAYEGDWLIWKQGKSVRRVPKNVIQMEGVSLKDWAAMHVTDDRIYVAVGSDIDGSFGLACVTRDGKELWRSSGWGSGALRGGVSGPWCALCEIKMSGNHILLFGEAFGALFIEGFDRESGEPLYRFCTRYLEERSANKGAGENNGGGTK